MKSIKSLSWIRGLLGLEAVAIPPQVFALDSGSVSYGAFARTPLSLELREFHRVPINSETFGEGLVGCDLREERSLREGLDELLGRMEEPVSEAALVLPDAWLRIAFAETSELPRSAAERDEVLRWKLKRLVPFRVDDLRLESIEVEALADQKEPRRLMLGFGAEALLGQLEAMFSSYGIRLGLVTNVSLSLIEAVMERQGDETLAGIVSVDRSGYVLAFARAGRPVLHRYKANDGGRYGVDPAKALRELKLTRAFLTERVPEVELETIHLHAPGELESQWTERIEEGLGAEVRLATQLADWPGAQGAEDLRGPLPLMGAACIRV